MSINTVPISSRNAGMDVQITANGSYTLPKYAFIPHPALHQLAGPRVNAPTDQTIPTAAFAAPASLARNLPTVAPVYAIRSIHLKRTP